MRIVKSRSLHIKAEVTTVKVVYIDLTGGCENLTEDIKTRSIKRMPGTVWIKYWTEWIDNFMNNILVFLICTDSEKTTITENVFIHIVCYFSKK